MEVSIEFLTEWFRYGRIPDIADPDLGVLRFEHGSWQSVDLVDGVRIEIHAGCKGPDPELRASALNARQHLRALESQTRECTARHADRLSPSPALRLIVVETRHTNQEWIRSEIEPREPAAAKAALVGTPMVFLTFEIEGDSNVLDAAFLHGKSVAWEYH